jgi:hypothetical protein
MCIAFCIFIFFVTHTYALYVCSLPGRFHDHIKGLIFVPYFLVAQSTRLGGAIAVPTSAFEKNVILPKFLAVPSFLVLVARSLM